MSVLEMPRPRQSDEAVVAYAARMVAARVIEEWDLKGDEDEWAKALAKVMRYIHRDGYELARELERYHGISPNSQLVEILDEAGFTLSDAYSDALEKWVKITGWFPKFAKGDRAVWRDRLGTVNGIQHKVGTYYFAPDDEAPRYANGGGYIVTDDALTASGMETRSAIDPKGRGPKGDSPPGRPKGAQ